MQIAKLPLDKGADRYAKYRDGGTPLDLATRSGHQDSITLMNRRASVLRLNRCAKMRSTQLDLPVGTNQIAKRLRRVLR